MLIQLRTGLVERGTKRRELPVQLAAHPHALRALAGEHERDRLGVLGGDSTYDPRGTLPTRERVESGERLVAPLPEHHGAISHRGAQRQRVPDVHRAERRCVEGVLAQATRLSTQTRLAAS